MGLATEQGRLTPKNEGKRREKRSDCKVAGSATAAFVVQIAANHTSRAVPAKNEWISLLSVLQTMHFIIMIIIIIIIPAKQSLRRHSCPCFY